MQTIRCTGYKHEILARKLGPIAGEVVSIAVVARQNDGAFKDHGAISLGPDAGVAVGHDGVTSYDAMVRVMVTHEVAAGDAFSTAPAESMPGRGGWCLEIWPETPILLKPLFS